MKKYLKISLSFWLLLLITFFNVYAQNLTEYNEFQSVSRNKTPIFSIYTLQGKNSQYDIESISSLEMNQWVKAKSNILNFGTMSHPIWCKIVIKDATRKEYLKFSNPLIDEIQLFFKSSSGELFSKSSGSALSFKLRDIKSRNLFYDISNSNDTIYARLKSNFHLQSLVKVDSLKSFMEEQHDTDMALSIYFGLMLIMVFYNLFVYFSVKDITYLYYIGYVFFVALTYASFKGVAFEYLWPNMPYINFLVPSISSTSTIFMTIFAISLLNAKKIVPKLTFGLQVIVVAFLISIAVNIAGNYLVSAIISQILTVFLSFYLILLGIVCHKKKVETAKFFLLAWTLFLFSMIVYILKLNGAISYNTFTNNSVLYGSAIESLLLSFALADRINILRKEKEEAQQKELEQRKEKQLILEKQTETLKIEVDKATKSLIEAQAQLVQSEKMASLGHFASGMSHEINNMMNISKTGTQALELNVSLLKEYTGKVEALSQVKEQIDSLKEEMELSEAYEVLDESIKFINSGIERTVGIVSNLKSFSKIDSSENTATDINKDIANLVDINKGDLLKDINVETDFGEVPALNCNSKMLNQSFHEILDNATTAIREKDMPITEGLIEITTKQENNAIVIAFKDNGIGMSGEVLEKAYDIFYTSKPVEKKGIGLSTAYGTVKSLGGDIQIQSKENTGTTVTITIPVQ